VTASLVFFNGLVHTVDRGDRLAEAVALEGDRIVAVGSDSECLALAGPGTRRIDLKGRSLTPGFIDAHHHFLGLGAAQEAIDCKAPGMQSIEAIVAAIRARATSTLPGEWIRGAGYDQTRLAERRHPTRADLDAATTQHPVIINRTCGHILVANSAALTAAGLGPETADPDGGRFDRDGEGHLNGVCYERAAVPIEAAAAPTDAEIGRWMLLADEAAGRAGLTSVHDAAGLTGRAASIAQDLVANGRLHTRIYAFTTVDSATHPDLAILESGYHTGFGDDRLRIGAFKIITDGSSSGPTAATRAPYTSDPSTSGIGYWRQPELNELMSRAHRAGWQCTVHAVGDRAIERSLDALEAAVTAHPRANLRHRIEHCGITPPDLQERIAAMAIVPAMQPAFFWEFGDGYIHNYGRERADHMFPVRSLIERGVVVAGSSDAPVTDHRPLFGIEQAITRATSGGDVCGPGERVDLATALRMHTVNGAYASFEEDRKGSVEAGRLADLVVTAENLTTVPVTRLRDMPIDFTVIGGVIVHET
jgi:predicted amidohydrolase YtcJ